ncbi:MAG TPA: class I SAM-dependent methyltransferase [Pyrinomonadaceae bacterium]
MLVVPAEFSRNSPTVTSLMTPEQSGVWLLEWMRLQIGFDSYADKKVLDFGCGVRFTQAIINTDFPFGRYFGVDVHRPMIEFLQREVRDGRFAYHFLDAHHPMYNPGGRPLTPETVLPIAEHDFDVACMFSVITHQYPDDSRSILTMLRRHVGARGRLFFSCFLDDSIGTFEDRSPNRNGGRCFYDPDFLKSIVESCGWRLVSTAPSVGPLIGQSFVYRAA